MAKLTDEEIVNRRFGPGFEKPCYHPQVSVCAYWECQVANACQGLRGPEKPAPIALLRSLPQANAGDE